MNPTSPKPDQNPAAKPSGNSRKIVTPYLHQLPFISKRITSHSPRTPRADERETPNISREHSREAFQSKNSLEVTSKSNIHQKALSPAGRETLRSLKSPRPSIVLSKGKESKGLSPQPSNENLSEIIPKMKLKTLKDKMIILRRIHEKAEAQKAAVAKNSGDLSKRKSKSIIPEFKEAKGPSDFISDLQDLLFEQMKKEIQQREKPVDSSISNNKIPFVSPRIFNESNRGERFISPSSSDLKGSIFIRTPGYYSTKHQDFMTSSKIKLDHELAQEPSLVSELHNQSKSYHKRGQSLSQVMAQIQMEKKNQNTSRSHSKKPVEILATSRKMSRENSLKDILAIEKNSSLFKPERLDLERLGLPRLTPINSPLDPFLNRGLEKSLTSFHLKLNESQKKDDTLAPSSESRKNALSSESRKNALVSTECCSSTKRKFSPEKEKKVHEDDELAIFNLTNFVKSSEQHGLNLNIKEEVNKGGHKKSESNSDSCRQRKKALDTIQKLFSQIQGPKAETTEKKHNRRSSQGF